MIRLATAILCAALAIILVLPWLMLWTALTGNADLMYASSIRATHFIALVLGIRTHVEGLENIPAKACIFVSNHISNIDSLALFPAIPRRLSVLAKKELFRIPILGWGMLQAKFISVNRTDRKAAVESANKAIRYLKDGLSFVVFAESTRSPDGRLQPFRKGAFVMAIQAGVPIVPVSLVGTQHLMPKGRSTVQPGEVTVRFGKPVDASQYSMEQRGELLAHLQSLVAEGLPPEQQPLPPHSGEVTRNAG